MWNTIINFFDKVNKAIPLDAIFWAGIAVVGVVLVLILLSCILKKRLVPMTIAWLYLIFSATVIMANPAVNIANALLYLEFPILVVLVCYLFFIMLKRFMRPRRNSDGEIVKVTKKSKKEKVEVNSLEGEPVEVKTIVEETVKEEKNDFTFNLDDEEEIKEPVIEKTVKIETVVKPEVKVEEPIKVEPKVEPIKVEPRVEVAPRQTFSFSTSTSGAAPVSSSSSLFTPRPTTPVSPRPVVPAAPVTPRPVINSTPAPTSGFQAPRFTPSTPSFNTPATPSNVNSSSNMFTPRPTTPVTPVAPRPVTTQAPASTSTGSSKSAQDVLDAIARLRASMNNKK